MKVKTTTLDKIAALLLFFLLTLATVCFGIERSKADTTLQKETIAPHYELIAFSAKQVANKKYINWTVASNQDNYYFLLERSTDGENFTAIHMKKGFISPKGQQLQYSFIDDESVQAEKFYYRIKLLEVQAFDVTNKKEILSMQDMFAKSSHALISFDNKQNVKP